MNRGWPAVNEVRVTLAADVVDACDAASALTGETRRATVNRAVHLYAALISNLHYGAEHLLYLDQANEPIMLLLPAGHRRLIRHAVMASGIAIAALLMTLAAVWWTVTHDA